MGQKDSYLPNPLEGFLFLLGRDKREMIKCILADLLNLMRGGEEC